MKIIAILLTIFLNSMLISSQKKENILKILRNVNNYFISNYPDPTLPTITDKERPSSLWTRAVYYEGLMELQKIDPNPHYLNYSLIWADFHKWTPRDGIHTTDADNQCCGQTYFNLLNYIRTSNPGEKIKNLLTNLDLQIASNRYNYWHWIDAIQMAMPLYAQAYIFTNNRKYINYAMKSYHWTRNECGGGLFNKTFGLWYRDADFVPPYKDDKKIECFWSRGNGWVYAALARVMEKIGKNDVYFNELKNDFILMSEAIAKTQRDDGFWDPSLISPEYYGGKETTGTSLFLYGMSWGIRNGILDDKKYRKIVDKTWRALEVDAVHPNGFLGYIQGTGKQPSEGQPVEYFHVPNFEDYGTGCFLLGGIEYYKLIE